jgi:asparagine synthase (glutamine-hydrolysing)
MCGIAGIVSFERALGETGLDAVRQMTEAEHHRGPDGCGLFHDSHVTFGHRRLSIIDTSEAGKQPMSNETGTVWVTYNGEIYNFRELRGQLVAAGHTFVSQSDTEVLVHGYEEWREEGLLRRLQGMFAFAIYDASRSRVILARDRLGIKPLYYTRDDRTGCLGFASEVKALLRGGLAAADMDRKALGGFLLFGSVPAPQTIVQNVRCLLPGHYLAVEPGSFDIRPYWKVDFDPTGDPDLPPLSEVLRAAAERHLVSDVPLGIFLSGGVDSAGLVALASSNQNLKTLTISFSESEFDEAGTARRIAEHFHTDHHELRVTGADFEKDLPKILAAMDQPTNDGVNTYFVARGAREIGLTVVLSGMGGDELFWGYPHYHRIARLNGWLKAFASAPACVKNACASSAVALGRFRGKESWMRLGALGSGPDPESLYLAFRGFFPSELAQRLLGNTCVEMNSLLGETLEALRPETQSTPANDLNLIEFKRYLHDQLLRDTDVFAMAHSVEVRVPYLDDEVVKRALATEASRKMSPSMNKPLLVEAIGDSLIEEAARRPKRGFSFPMAKWIHERNGAMRERAMATQVLDREVVGKIWSAFEGGRMHWSRAWALVVLGAII